MSLRVWGASALLLSCAPCTAAQTAISIPAPLSSSARDPQPAPTAEPFAQSCCKVPALTSVELEFVDPASSRSSKSGEMIALRLAEPLVIGGHVVVPAGARAFAEVIQASKAGLMGKAGELTFAARYIENGSARIRLKRFGFGPSQGKDPSGALLAINTATAVALPVASVALLFISGGNIEVKPGARAHAVVAAETFVPTDE